MQLVSVQLVCSFTFCPDWKFSVWNPSMVAFWSAVQLPEVVHRAWTRSVWSVCVSFVSVVLWSTRKLSSGLVPWTEQQCTGPRCVWVVFGGSAGSVGDFCACSSSVSLWSGWLVERPVLNWFTVARIPPSSRLCLWKTGPFGVYAVAVTALVCLKSAVLRPAADGVFWFCSMSISKFGPPDVLSSFCVTLAEPVAV